MNPSSHVTCPDFARLPSIHHAFLTRHIPGSTHQYLQRDPSSIQPDLIAENRGRAMDILGLPRPALSLLNQVHSPTVLTITSPNRGISLPDADAHVTNTPGIALGILTADCVPILLASPKNQVIGAIHAGWKGARNNIIERTLTAMTDLGATLSDIHAVVGPCIHQPSYEVGPEFFAHFIEENPENEALFIPSADNPTHFYFDLPGYVDGKLRQAKIAHISHTPYDTYRDDEMFFSFRRCTKTGQLYYQNGLSVVMITP